MTDNEGQVVFIGTVLVGIAVFFAGYGLGHHNAEMSCRDHYADKSYAEVQKFCKDIVYDRQAK